MDQIGKYIVLEEIGQGGMGVVYKARDPIIGREVAVKVIIERIMRSPDLKARFLREIASAGRLSHENIMTIYDAGDHEGRPYFVMELLSGNDLSAVIRRGMLSLDRKIAVAQQVARGLRYAHERGIIHRDVKPDNVRVLDSGRAKIMDFGIARIESATRTPTHSSIGTPRYMSPEQIKGEHVDGRTDVFSFGALFYELLTGTPPFAGERITTVIYKILHETPAPMDLGTVPGAETLRRIVERSLEKDLDARYADFDEVLADLDAVAAERDAVTPTATALPPESVERAEDEAAPPDDTVVVPLSEEPTSPPTDETVAETLKASPAPEPERRARPVPVRAVVFGAIGLLAVLGLTYVIAQPGSETDPEPEETVAAMADSPAAQPLAPPLEPDSVDFDTTDEPVGTESTQDEPPEEREPEPEPTPSEADRARAAAQTATRQQAEQAQQAMTEARADVEDRRADPRIADDFARAETRRTTAERQLRNGDFQQSAAAFDEARSLYAAAAQTAAEPPDPEPEPEREPEPEPTEPETMEPEPTEPSPEERAQAAAEQTAGSLAAQLRQALEREDAAAMRAVHSTYDGWGGFFRIADNVRASVGVDAVEVSGDRATADVSLRIQFRNTSKNEDETTNVRYRWTLEPRDDTWALTAVATR